jgi:multidrug efflux pump
LAGVRLEVRKEEAGPPVGKPIQVQLSARFPERLEPVVVCKFQSEIGPRKRLDDLTVAE